jgi:uncharacterized protein
MRVAGLPLAGDGKTTMIHPDTELRFISDDVGHGVFATALIPRGTITWVRDDFDILLSKEEFEQLEPLYRTLPDKYAYLDAEGVYVLCWDIAKYVNHSCHPNCLGGTAEFEVAVRDVRPGEELRCDYATLNLDQPESFRCRCGARNCRRTIRPEDAAVLAEEWAQTLHAACSLAETVPQPLMPFFRDSGFDAVRPFGAGGVPFPTRPPAASPAPDAVAAARPASS